VGFRVKGLGQRAHARLGTCLWAGRWCVRLSTALAPAFWAGLGCVWHVAAVCLSGPLIDCTPPMRFLVVGAWLGSAPLNLCARAQGTIPFEAVLFCVPNRTNCPILCVQGTIPLEAVLFCVPNMTNCPILCAQGTNPLEAVLEKVGAGLVSMGDAMKAAGVAIGGFFSRLGERLLGAPRRGGAASGLGV
jgi:hypothetical protein